MMQSTRRSLISPIGYQSGDCGYCKDEGEQSASYYARSTSLAPQDYQHLMDRGWRRSGSLLYMPDASRSCCPHYTIRLPAAELKTTRDQRQAVHRWNRFVLGEKYIKEVASKYPKTKEEKRTQNEFHLLRAIHESERSNLKPGIEPAHRFEVTLEPDDFTEEKYALFDNYQRHVHHEGDDDISRAGFKRFLCTSPLHRIPATRTNPQDLGSYHLCYRLDGRLIALAVLDLLPHAVSGVYFLYHSDHSTASFGKLSALREVALAREQNHTFYYMGYYIHGCRKMRYKGDYRPQFILDYEAGTWDPMDAQMSRLMDARKWVSMSRERAAGLPPPDTEANAKPETDAESNLYPPPLHPVPTSASMSSLSLLILGMPGVLTPAQLAEEVDLDVMRFTLGAVRGGDVGVHAMQDLRGWEAGDVMDIRGIKGMVGELAAVLGGTVAGRVIVDFGR